MHEYMMQKQSALTPSSVLANLGEALSAVPSVQSGCCHLAMEGFLTCKPDSSKGSKGSLSNLQTCQPKTSDSSKIGFEKRQKGEHRNYENIGFQK